MILNKLISRLKLNKSVNACLLCSKSELFVNKENEDTSQTKTEINEERTEKRRPPGKKHILELEKFFLDNPHLQEYKEIIPEKFLHYTTPSPEYMYLVCPKIARKVACHVLPNISTNKNHVVAETNPGLAFIAEELINKGIPTVRLYENCLDFHKIIKHKNKGILNHLQLFNKDLFKLYIYSHIDKYDQGHRVSTLLNGVPKKSWVDEPVMTVVGTMTDLSFIRYLIKSIVLQREIITYGRTDIFAIIFPLQWAVLNSTAENSLITYKPWTILFLTFFEVKLLDKFSRKFFFPWPSKTKILKYNHLNLDKDNVYLVQISMRKNFCLNAEEFVPFFCFVKTFLRSGKKLVIPTCEKWVPGCGINFIVPKLNHEYYYEDMNIFTRFRDLNPKQIIAVFKEMAALPGYEGSPFMDMVEQEMIKSETISSDIHDTHKYRRKFTDTDFYKQ